MMKLSKLSGCLGTSGSLGTACLGIVEGDLSVSGLSSSPHLGASSHDFKLVD